MRSAVGGLSKFNNADPLRDSNSDIDEAHKSTNKDSDSQKNSMNVLASHSNNSSDGFKTKSSFPQP
jgi:hypothetical protein